VSLRPNNALVRDSRIKRACPTTEPLGEQRMTKQQQSIVSTWIIGPTTALLALRVENTSSYSWMFVLLIGFGICRYLRRGFPKDASTMFDGMSNKIKIIILIYYVTLSALIFYIVLMFPESINYNDSQFLVFLFALTLPLVPGWLKYELKLYKWAGSNVA